MRTSDILVECIDDQIDGPHYGEDFIIDDHGFVQVHSAKQAGLIMRKVNQSNLFDDKLVRLGNHGDCVILGFDTLTTQVPVFETTVGYEKLPVEIKQTNEGKFCIYVGSKRSSRLFNKLAGAKKYIKQLDKELSEVAGFQDTEQEDDQ